MTTSRLWMTRLAVIGVVLTLCVVALGAWTRLSDAGLGCPDWPGCYGSITVPLTDSAIQQAAVLYPDQPLVAAKAWPEMIHRHFAKAIGLICLIIAIFAWRGRAESGLPWRHGVFLLFLVCVQGAFGAFTVTMKLFPPVVTGHLLLGFTTFTTLFFLALRLSPFFREPVDRKLLGLRPLVVVAIVALVTQIALGGWTASNYAATMCAGLPICQDGWTTMLNWTEAFRFHRYEAYAGTGYEFAPHLDAAAKLTIHVAHRIGAGVVLVLVSALIFLLALRAEAARYRLFAAWLCVMLTLQIALGVSNIVFHLPLAVAVAHNLVALLLLQVLVALWYSLRQESRV